MEVIRCSQFGQIVRILTNCRDFKYPKRPATRCARITSSARVLSTKKMSPGLALLLWVDRELRVGSVGSVNLSYRCVNALHFWELSDLLLYSSPTLCVGIHGMRRLFSRGMTFCARPFGAEFPLFVTAMLHNLGVNWACTLLGCLTVVFVPAPFILLRYGRRLRMASKYARDNT
jgi:hypothetical protein